jgi:hypothetical protein
MLFEAGTVRLRLQAGPCLTQPSQRVSAPSLSEAFRPVTVVLSAGADGAVAKPLGCPCGLFPM